MSRDAARILMDIVTRHAAEQDAALIEIRAECTPREFTRYKEMIGKSMGAILLDAINPIVSKYPDLMPREMT